MAYTKGPWKVDDGDSTFRIRQTEGPWHCVAIVTGGVDADDESPQGPVYCANAQLIAAAPALYEALKAYRQHRDEHERDTAEVRLSEQPCRVCHERFGVVSHEPEPDQCDDCRIDQALAQAEGHA